jgi:hypothetical protein
MSMMMVLPLMEDTAYRIEPCLRNETRIQKKYIRTLLDTLMNTLIMRINMFLSGRDMDRIERYGEKP